MMIMDKSSTRPAVPYGDDSTWDITFTSSDINRGWCTEATANHARYIAALVARSEGRGKKDLQSGDVGEFAKAQKMAPWLMEHCQELYCEQVVFPVTVPLFEPVTTDAAFAPVVATDRDLKRAKLSLLIHNQVRAKTPDELLSGWRSTHAMCARASSMAEVSIQQARMRYREQLTRDRIVR